ncbi:MAG: hypothetical protein JNL53_14110 [Cyclobacteriaceae bacterium]|nr:hypothetical protein [Cyclobacteriaceae bacterium]
MRISKELALKLLIGLFITVVIFHLLIVFQIIPYTIVWAGKLKTIDEMYAFEAASISINVFLGAVLVLKGNYITHRIPERVLNTILWVFMVLFALNTIGNLMAESLFEKVVFTPLTLLSSVLIWIVVRRE